MSRFQLPGGPFRTARAPFSNHLNKPLLSGPGTPTELLLTVKFALQFTGPGQSYISFWMLTPPVSNQSAFWAPISRGAILHFHPETAAVREQVPVSAPIFSMTHSLRFLKPTYAFWNSFSFYKCHHLKIFRRQIFLYMSFCFCQTGGTEEPPSMVDAKVWWSSDAISREQCAYALHTVGSKDILVCLNGIRTWTSRVAF